MVDKTPLPQGKQGNPLDRQVAAQGSVTTNDKVVGFDMPPSMLRRVKRQPMQHVVQESSDDFVDQVDEDKMGQIQHSADHLGL
jgi:uncharacterized protein YaaW (UPF0174 family)